MDLEETNPARDRTDQPAWSEADLAELMRLKRELAEIKSLLRLRRELREAKTYHPEQPRAPAGTRAGGQWTSEGAQGSPTRLAGPTGRGPRSPIGRPQLEPTPGQAARLAIAEAQARNAIARVRELDPKWKPTPSFRETVEGQILTAQEETLEAHARLRELASLGIGPGPNAHGSLLARGPGRDFHVREREEGNRIGQEWGCHTCGKQNPGTPLGNFVLDHQPPTALNPFGRVQRLYPQCASCSRIQGGWVNGLKPR